MKSLHLKNFQKHCSLDLYFDDKVNIICGPTGCGKSRIRQAIEFLLNESVDNPIKEGEKKCSVCAKFDNNIEIERIRSATVNRYILKQGEDQQTFDSVGKNLPEEIQKVFKFLPLVCDKESINLNISKQITLPFLMDKSPTWRMKLFNQLTGNSLIDELLVDYNKENFNINKELKIHTENLDKLEKDVEASQKEYDSVNKQYCSKSELYQKIKAKFERFVKLQEIVSKLNNCYELQENIDKEQKEIKLLEVDYLEELRKKIDRLEKIKMLSLALRDTKKKKATLDAEISKLSLQPINTQEIEGKLKRYETLKSAFDKFKGNKDKCSQISGQIEKVDIELKEIQKEKNKYEVCPSCEGSGILIK